MYKIKFSPDAANDLNETHTYITEELGSVSAATRTVRAITDKIKQLASYPELGTPLSAVVSIETAYRFLVCGNYLVFYRIEQDAVYIIRILYGRRNYMQVLFGKEPPET